MDTQTETQTQNKADTVMNDVVTYGLIVRAPMYVINEIRDLLRRHEEAVLFQYPRISSGKLRIEEWRD